MSKICNPRQDLRCRWCYNSLTQWVPSSLPQYSDYFSNSCLNMYKNKHNNTLDFLFQLVLYWHSVTCLMTYFQNGLITHLRVGQLFTQHQICQNLTESITTLRKDNGIPSEFSWLIAIHDEACDGLDVTNHGHKNGIFLSFLQCGDYFSPRPLITINYPTAFKGFFFQYLLVG